MSGVFQNAIRSFLSPIGDLLEDPMVTEIMINGHREIFAERKGLVYRTPNQFPHEDALISAVRSIAQSVGRRIDEENPILEARLPDGSRIQVVLPPMSRKGTTVAIRKFSQEKLSLKDLITFGSLDKIGARFLDICIYLGKNIIVSGGTGSGKTTMLNVLGSRIPKEQRLIVIEDAAELQIKAEHVVSFETRKPDPLTGLPEVSIQELVRAAMRLRPDRIMIGEVRGTEALDLIQMMNTGHDGSMGTVHANNPLDTCTRLETLCLSGETKIPPDSIRKMIASAIDIVVQCKRYNDGGRRVSHISEIVGLDHHGHYITRDIYKWIQQGKDPKTGKYYGEMAPCNNIPGFFRDIIVNKLPFPKASFLRSDAPIPDEEAA